MRDRAEHPNALARLSGQSIDDVALRTVPRDDQCEALPRRGQAPEGLHRHRESLAFVEPTDEQELGPAPRSAGVAPANAVASTPFGMISNGPPMRERSNAAARSDTAIRIASRRATRRINGAARS
jgi:hypothetical protein